MDTDLAFKLAELQSQIAELGRFVRQLQKAAMNSTSAQLLIARKRGRAGTPHELRWRDQAASPPWIKALGDVRRTRDVVGMRPFLPPAC
jgi:hypothetical protein